MQIRCRALLFDMDGVLVDSTPAVARVWTAWANRFGLVPAEVVRQAHGRPSIATIRELCPPPIIALRTKPSKKPRLQMLRTSSHCRVPNSSLTHSPRSLRGRNLRNPSARSCPPSSSRLRHSKTPGHRQQHPTRKPHPEPTCAELTVSDSRRRLRRDRTPRLELSPAKPRVLRARLATTTPDSASRPRVPIGSSPTAATFISTPLRKTKTCSWNCLAGGQRRFDDQDQP